MQTYSNYGFILTNAQNLSEKIFNDISGIINETCLRAKQACRNIPHEPLVVSFPINRTQELFGTLCISDNDVSFAIIKKNFFCSSCDVVELTSLLKPSSVSIPTRTRNQIELALSGKLSPNVLTNEKIKEMWQKQFPQLFYETQMEEFYDNNPRNY